MARHLNGQCDHSAGDDRSPGSVRRRTTAVGNQHVGGLLALQQSVGNRAVQRMVLAIGDLEELARTPDRGMSDEQRRSALQITTASQYYMKSTGEKQAHPWEVSRWLGLQKGGLSQLAENLRIYGHGQSYEGNVEVAEIGGYTPQRLTEKLIAMGMPKVYKHEIYLTGCDTASGEGFGFLGKFHELLRVHCPSVIVCGNLGTAVTFEDGAQGVWNDRFSHEEYDAAFIRANKAIAEVTAEIRKVKEGAPTESDASQPDFDERVQTFADEISKLSELMQLRKREKAQLVEAAYSRGLDRTHTLP